jgi:hypothetical protein
MGPPFTVNRRPERTARMVQNPLLANARSGNERLAAEIPEFGGAFWDDQRVFNVYLTDVAKAGERMGAIRRELSRIREAGAAIRILRGKCTWAQLSSFEKTISRHYPKEVVFGGIDARQNRYRLELETEEARVGMIHTIVALGLPIDAFVLVRNNRFTPP